jgi:hypothetical protein
MMTVREKHFVSFYSPGTMFAEQTSREIDAWSPALACKMAQEIVERHASKPYGFRFETRLVSDPIDDGRGGKLSVDSKKIAESGTYFITGEVIRLDDIPDTQENNILRSNMRCNDYPIVVENRNSWKSVQPFGEGDSIVDRDGRVLVKGSDPELVAYRKKRIAEHDAEMQSFRQSRVS